jgi:hypothetical protein
MTLIKKRDVKDYFAARRLKGSPILMVPASKPATPDIPKKERASVKSAPLSFNQDFTADHSKSAKTAKAPAAFGRESL